MTNTIKYCWFCDNDYTKNCQNEYKNGLAISPTGKIVYDNGYFEATLPTGRYYDSNEWYHTLTRKPRSAFKGCKFSHGRCNICSGSSGSPPFFSDGRATQSGGYNKKVSWFKQKGMKKQLNKYIKFTFR